MRLLVLFFLMAIAATTVPAQAAKEAAEFVPQWAKHAIWYQIFPERFRNGDASNDPKKKDIEAAYPHEPDADW